jgi:hypothetical protein
MKSNRYALSVAYKTNDIARVRELFATRPLTEHGADLARYLLTASPPSLDMVKVLVEFGYDLKVEGHRILQ